MSGAAESLDLDLRTLNLYLDLSSIPLCTAWIQHHALAQRVGAKVQQSGTDLGWGTGTSSADIRYFEQGFGQGFSCVPAKGQE